MFYRQKSKTKIEGTYIYLTFLALKILAEITGSWLSGICIMSYVKGSF